jgi:hypothetical protein
MDFNRAFARLGAFWGNLARGKSRGDGPNEQNKQRRCRRSCSSLEVGAASSRTRQRTSERVEKKKG